MPAGGTYYGHNAAQDTLYKMLFGGEEEGISKAVIDAATGTNSAKATGTTSPSPSSATISTNQISSNNSSSSGGSNTPVVQGSSSGSSPGMGLPNILAKGAGALAGYGLSKSGLGELSGVANNIISGALGNGVTAKGVGNAAISTGLAMAGVPGLLMMALKAFGFDPVEGFNSLGDSKDYAEEGGHPGGFFKQSSDYDGYTPGQVYEPGQKQLRENLAQALIDAVQPEAAVNAVVDPVQQTGGSGLSSQDIADAVVQAINNRNSGNSTNQGGWGAQGNGTMIWAGNDYSNNQDYSDYA